MILQGTLTITNLSLKSNLFRIESCQEGYSWSKFGLKIKFCCNGVSAANGVGLECADNSPLCHWKNPLQSVLNVRSNRRSAVMELGIDYPCCLIGCACRVCRIWLDRVVVCPLLYQTRFCIHDQSANRLKDNNTDSQCLIPCRGTVGRKLSIGLRCVVKSPRCCRKIQLVLNVRSMLT